MKRVGFVILGMVGSLSACKPDIEMSTVPKVVVAQFDPTATPPVVPLPNDLIKNAKTGLLDVPAEGPDASAAQKEFNAYLRTLDGFPPASPVTTTFSDAIDGASLKSSNAKQDGSVAVFDATTLQPLTDSDYSLQLSSDKKTVTVVPHLPSGGKPSMQPWQLGHTYLVIMFGGDDPSGIKAADASLKVVASPTTFFLRSQRPLLTLCADNDPKIAEVDCLCPRTDSTYDSACRVGTGLLRDQATQLESLRQPLALLLKRVLPAAGTGKLSANIVQVWSFSIARGPFAVFDPPSNRVPFPNDVLIDQSTGKVNLPIADPMSTFGKIYAQLNLLDGFSTTASATVSVDEADDNHNAIPVGLSANATVLLINSSMPSAAPTFSTQPEMVNGGKDWDGLIQITPIRPLRPDQTEYLAVLTSDITDSKGRALRPSTLMEFVKLNAPLVDSSGHSTLPGTLTDANAAQLEVLRSAYAKMGLWQALAMAPFSIPKEKVAMVWTFRTQSMTKTLQTLAAYPATNMIPTDVKNLDAQPTGGGFGPHVGQIVYGTMHTHLALSNGGAPGATIDLKGGKDTDVPFLMLAPATNTAKGIVIVQHGFTRWRGDIVAIAEAFTKAGWAIIGIDINFHGARSACTKDAECNGGTCKADGSCSTSLLVKCSSDTQCTGGAVGSCDPKSGACSPGFAKFSSLCLSYVKGGGPVTECNPVATGSGFLYFPNPFSVRDNLRQHVLDLSQLERVLVADGMGSLKVQLAALATPILVDNARTAYVGQSLGGIEGALFLSVAKSPITGVLNVPGGRLVDVILKSPAFSPLVTPLIAAFNLTVDTPAYYQLLDVFRWITDPGDPINFGRYIVNESFDGVPPKNVIVQEAGKDMVIPNEQTESLAMEIGVPFVNGHAGISAVPASMPMGFAEQVSTYFPLASHGFIFSGETSTVAGQIQAVTWIDSDGKLIAPAFP